MKLDFIPPPSLILSRKAKFTSCFLYAIICLRFWKVSHFFRKEESLVKYVKSEDDVNIYMDPYFGIPNVKLYRENMKKCNYNKLCMTEIVNADLTIATVGIDTYYEGCTDVLKMVKQSLKESGLGHLIHVYAVNYKNFILVADERIKPKDFVTLMKELYARYEHATADGSEVSGVSRFAIVLESNNMIEQAISTFLQNKGSQENFLICSNDILSLDPLYEHTDVVELLTRAVNHDNIVPYYQGIHNNELGRIDKYEALMRIVDDDGTVYLPYIFLDIAKQYKFYNKISRMMIERALTEFEGRDEDVSVNISLFDIDTESFRNWFYQFLENYKSPDKIVIEFVETEDFVEDEIYFSFIKRVRSHGCKIALDDFGAGYSSYARVISLKPDFIKVDGSIIKDITTINENLTILQSICFLAHLIEAEIVAEFVDRDDVQRLLRRCEIPYSQGYYFAKPKPLEEL